MAGRKQRAGRTRRAFSAEFNCEAVQRAMATAERNHRRCGKPNQSGYGIERRGRLPPIEGISLGE